MVLSQPLAPKILMEDDFEAMRGSGGRTPLRSASYGHPPVALVHEQV